MTWRDREPTEEGSEQMLHYFNNLIHLILSNILFLFDGKCKICWVLGVQGGWGAGGGLLTPVYRY